MLRKDTFVAIATMSALCAAVSLVGCSGSLYEHAPRAEGKAADGYAESEGRGVAVDTDGDGKPDTVLGLVSRDAAIGIPAAPVDAPRAPGATPWPTPTTATYSYVPTTYFPTYYPTTPTPGTLANPQAGDLPQAGRFKQRPAWEPGPGEELWVIERPAVEGQMPGRAADPADDPGQGQLFGRQDDGTLLPAPLQHTDVQARIQGHVGTVHVTQQYANPWASKIEAVYVFPLPTTAAVSEFLMIVGERKIRGVIREKEEAEQIYAEARAAGHVASIMTQERPNIFRQKVANIEPGHQIDIAITYFETLDYRDGWYEWHFPMVVGPRFNPPGHTDGVGAKNYGGNAEGQPVGVTYNTDPQARPGNDIALSVEIDAGVTIEEMACTTHAVERATPESHVAQVRLHPMDSIPNKDFVLRWRVASDQLKSTCTIQHDGKDGGWFTLTLYPPQRVQRTARRPMELLFVLDCSGSMNGVPIHKAKQATIRALRKLQPTDTFQVIRFSNDASQLGAAPLPATPANIQRGIAYVNGLAGMGGTMMVEGIKCALDYPLTDGRQRVVSFMTDGYIGNEQEIFQAVEQRLRTTRLFSFGVGSSPNRYLLEGLARMGRGAVAWVGLDEATGGAAVDGFFDRISAPALTDVGIDFTGWKVSELYPRRIPELYVGRPITVVGRFHGLPDGPITLKGRDASGTHEFPISPSVAMHPGIDKIWARLKIADLFMQYAVDAENRPGIQQVITDTALTHGILSQWTAFLAVDASRVTEGRTGTTVEQEVPLPEGMTPPSGNARDD